MKKLSKLIIFLLVLVMGAGFMPVSALLTSVSASATIKSSTITVEGFVNQGNIGSTIFVPKAKNNEGLTTIKVINPNGVDVTLTELAENGANYLLTPTTTGAYNVIYGVSSTELPVNGHAFNTQETRFQIIVNGTGPVMNFEKNSQYIIPSKIGDNTTVVLPYPTIIGTDGEEVSLDNVIANTTITITKPAGVSGDINRTTQTINNKNYVKFTTVENGNGIYTISYTYVDPNVNTLTVSKSFEIIASTTYEAPTEFTTSRSGSVPSTLELGQKTTLPTYTLKDKDGNVLQSYTKIEATYIPANSTGTDHINCNEEIDGYDFTPTHEAKNGAVYQIIYKIYDFANLSEDAVVTKTHTITSVKDTTSPTPYPVADYDTIQNSVLNAKDYYLENASYLVPSKVAKGESRNIPAIFARDAYDVSLPTNITLTRKIITPENKPDSNFVDNDTTKSINYEFKMEGTYTIKYIATDEANNVSNTISYDVIVENGFVDNIAPRITLATAMPSYAKEGSLIKFLKPVAVDYASSSITETSVNDTRVKVESFYYTNNADNKIKIEEDKTNNAYLAFTIPSDVVGNTVTIYIKATDDYNNVSFKEVVINLPYINDTAVPTLTSSITNNIYNQSDPIELPELIFNDDNIQYATISIDVIDAEGNMIDVYGLSPTLINENEIRLQAKNAKCIPTVSGTYTAIYTVKDIAGNNIIVAFAFEVVDNIIPVVTGPSVWTDEIEVGVSTFLPSSIVTDNGVEIENSSLTKIELVSENHSSNFALNNYTLEFVSYVAGTYEFRYIGKDAAGNSSLPSKTYTLVVKDNYKPEINVLSGLKATYDLTKTNAVYNDILIPGFTATDIHYDENGNVISYNNIRTRTITIKDPDQKKLDIKIAGVSQNSTEVSVYASEYGFTPTKAGAYTIIYYAQDAAKNETKLEKTIYVGDHVAPNITVDNNEIEKFEASFKIGDTLSLDMSKITATDDDALVPTITFDTIKTGTVEEKLMAVKVVGPSGTISRILTTNNVNSTDATPIYQLNQAGSYTVTYTVKDNTGNSATKVFTFTVDAEEEKVVIGTEVWGIILIIIAIAILAGIIIYFVKTRKIKSKPTAIIRK